MAMGNENNNDVNKEKIDTEVKSVENNHFNEKFRRLLGDNRFLLVLSFVLAFILWIVVSLSTHTEKTAIVSDVPIYFDLPDYVKTELGLNIIDSDKDTVNVSITGNAYIIGQVTRDDLVVSAKIQNITESGNYDVSLSCNSKGGTFNNFTIESCFPSVVNVRLDRTIEKEYAVEVSTNDYTAGSGYNLSEPQLTNATIMISGPEADMKEISRVVVESTVDSKISKTSTYTGKVVLYDSLDQPIENSALKLGFSETQIVIIARSIKSIPFAVEYINAPANVDTIPIEFTPSSIEVSAPDDVFEGLTAINLGTLDFSKIDKQHLTVDYNVALPSGIVNMSDKQEVEVKVNLWGYTSKDIVIDKFTIMAPDSKYNYDVTSESITVRISGRADDIQKITADDIVVRIPAELVTQQGQNEVPVLVRMEDYDSCWVYGEPTVFVNRENKK